MDIDKEDAMEMNKQLGRIANALESLANCVSLNDESLKVTQLH